MNLNLKLSQKGLLLVGFLLSIELIFIGTLSFLLNRAEYETWKESHAKAVVVKADSILNLFYSAAGALTGYINLRSAKYRERLDSIIDELSEENRTFQLLCMDSPNTKHDITRVREQIDRTIQVLKEYKSRLEGSDQSVKLFRLADMASQLEANYDQLEESLHGLTRQEKQIASESPGDREETKFRLLVKNCLYAGIGVNVLLAVFLGISFTKEITDRLAIMTDNTYRLSKKQPLNETLPGSDEISHLDHTFHEMADALKELDRLKQEFFAMVTHDLRSPMTAIQGTLGLLSSGAYGPQSEKAIHGISLAERSIKRLVGLINDLLDIEKIEAGKWELTFSTVSVSDIVEQSIESVQVLAQQKEITFETKTGALEIYADEKRLIQVLVNLLSNAIKYSPEKGKIRVTVERPRGWVEIRVSDQGRGIPEDDLSKVFDRFQQVEASDATAKGGTGLGLAVCQGIIAEHKGTIGVESELGHGATFWFRIPTLQGAREAM